MKRTGFTLVEILIVVIVLGILAAIVIAQFSEATDDAKLSAMCRDLQTVRSQLERYRLEHDSYPDGADSDAWTVQLTQMTDIDGAAGTDYGPYLQTFPTNPFNESGAVVIDADGSSAPGAQFASGAGACGWYFNAATGKFTANDEGVGGHGGL